MIYYVLLCVSIVLAVVKSAFYNKYAKSEKPDFGGILAFNAVCYGAALVTSFFFGIKLTFSIPTVICAFFYAINVCLLQGLSVYAMKLGPMTASSLISLYGMIIPTISGPLFWHEPFGIIQFSGVTLMLISMFLLSVNERSNKNIDKKWFPVIIAVFFLSGMAGVIEKIHQSTDGRNEKAQFLCIAYLIMFVISLCGRFMLTNKSKKIVSVKRVSLIGIISGVIIGVYALTNLTLAGKLNSTVYYPVANGGALILTVVVSATVFHERCTVKQLVGIIIGLVSVILLSF